MADTIKIGTRIPQGIMLRVGEVFKGIEGQEQVRETGAYFIPGSERHLGYAPGNLHHEDAFVPYAEIPTEDWRSWCEMNKGSDLLTSGALFEHDGRSPDDEEPVKAEVLPAKQTNIMSDDELEKATRP